MTTSENKQEHNEHETSIVGDVLHAVGDTATVTHMSGVHLHGKQKYIGLLIEIISEIVHNHSDNLAEQIICGAGVAFVKEAVNTAVATQASVAAGAAATIATSPAGGAIVAASVGFTAYKLTNEFTEPLGHLVQNVCHDVLNTDFGFQYYQQAVDLYYQQKYEDALNKVNEALRINPNFADAHSFQGLCYYTLGQYEKSITAYNQVLVFDANNHWVYFNRALAHIKQNSPIQALNDINQFLKYESQHTTGLAIKNEIEEEILENLANGNSKTQTDLDHELIEAAKVGDVDKASALMELGANPNAIDKTYFNYTPLHWAAGYGHKAVAELLLVSGANLNSQALCGHNTPLNVSRCNPNNQPLQDFLIAYQNKIDRELIEAAKIDDANKVATLLKNGANPNARDGCYFHYTPLMWACGHNAEKTVPVLLNAEADPNIRSANGYSALDIALTHPGTMQIRTMLSAAGGKAIQTEYEQEVARQQQVARQATKAQGIALARRMAQPVQFGDQSYFSREQISRNASNSVQKNLEDSQIMLSKKAFFEIDRDRRQAEINQYQKIRYITKNNPNPNLVLPGTDSSTISTLSNTSCAMNPSTLLTPAQRPEVITTLLPPLKIYSSTPSSSTSSSLQKSPISVTVSPAPVKSYQCFRLYAPRPDIGRHHAGLYCRNSGSNDRYKLVSQNPRACADNNNCHISKLDLKN